MTWLYRIPLWGKGRSVAGWALVDPEDFYELYAYRWHLLKGYANRTAPRDDGSMLNTQIAMHRQVLRLNRLGAFVDEEEAGTAAQVFRLEHMSHATD